MNKLIVALCLTGAVLASQAMPSDARASVGSRRQQRAQQCKAGIARIVDRTYFGTPAIRFTGSRRTQAIDVAYEAVQRGLSSNAVYSQTYARLWMVRNTYFRRDIANAAASIARQAGALDACKK